MNADTVTAICATAVATASFVVSIQQVRASRQHNRLSVQPVLQVWNEHRVGGKTGMSLENHGLGPAFVIASRVWLDGVHLGHWGYEAMNALRAELQQPLRAVEMNRRPWILPAGASRSLLYVDCYDEAQHGGLMDLIRNRLAVEFVYESVYGGEAFRIAYRMENLRTGPAGTAGA
ncbi:hypothetical protein ACWDSD_41710 [Streptomyces spiralis]